MKRLFCFLFACGLVLSAKADDGGTRFPEEWTYGNIYVKEPNKSIALEKEYMCVSGDRVEAVFCFRNTTDSTVVVPCAFPIVITAPFRFYDDTLSLKPWFTGCDLDGNEFPGNNSSDDLFYRIALDRDIKWFYWEEEDGQLLLMTKQEIKERDKKLRVIDYSEFQNKYLLSEYKTRRYYKGCNVVQDGDTVELKSVGIETNVNLQEGKDRESEMELVLHFYHELTFAPNTQSKVCIDYYAKSLYEYENYPSYRGHYKLNYDISTGGTWKDGIIGSFVLQSDYNVDNTFGLQCSQIIPIVYSARNYKPIGRFCFYGYSDIDLNKWKGLIWPPEKPKTKQISLQKKGNEVVETNKRTDAHFLPFIIGNRIKFNIDETCLGPFVANGYVDCDVFAENKELPYSSERIYQKDNLWPKYSRIKTAILTNEDEGWSDTLQLEDRFPAYPYIVNPNFNDGWFGANAVRNVRVLRPGSYTLTVKDIYKGDSTESVGVSHIWFYPVDNTLVSIIDEDKNSTMPLFSNVWNRVLDISIDDVELKLENIDFENDGNEDVVEIDEQKQESPAERKVVKVEADKSKSAVLFVVVALVALSVLAVVIVVVRKRKSRSK
ncbi:MAG: hypothetical protein IKZ99_00795 [Salinivirgaceae bacterium]|nr:hypothetical protein [Salinivirgaceae bacterium]